MVNTAEVTLEGTALTISALVRHSRLPARFITILVRGTKSLARALHLSPFSTHNDDFVEKCFHLHPRRVVGAEESVQQSLSHSVYFGYTYVERDSRCLRRRVERDWRRVRE